MSSLQKRKLKRGYTFILRFRDDSGKQHSKSLKTDDLGVAKRIKSIADARLAKQCWNLERPKKRITLEEFRRLYIDKYSSVNKAPKTVALDNAALKVFKKCVGDLQLSAIKPQLIEVFKSERIKNVSPVTLNLELRHLKAALNIAREWDYLKTNPFSQIKQLKIPDSNLPKYLNIEQVQKFLGIINNPVHLALYSFYAWTGCRRSEALKIHWKDIDFENGMILFRETKSGRARVVPLRSSLKRLLLDLPQQSERLFPFESSYVSRLFKKYAKKSGLPRGLSLHSLRHSFLTYAVSTSKNLRGAQSLAGHSDISVTEIYTHLLPEDLRSIIAGLPY